jgi:hypothetical protein
LDDLLDIIRWNITDPYKLVRVSKRTKKGAIRTVSQLEPRPRGEGGLVLYNKRRFVELAFLAGYQACQRLAGTGNSSPKFVVDVEMRLKTKGKTKILGWDIRRKDGTGMRLEANEVIRKSKPAGKALKSKKNQSAAVPDRQTGALFPQALED